LLWERSRLLPVGEDRDGLFFFNDLATTEIYTLSLRDPLPISTIAALYVGGLAGDFAAKKLGMRTMVASDIREHFSDAIRFLDPRGEQP